MQHVVLAALLLAANAWRFNDYAPCQPASASSQKDMYKTNFHKKLHTNVTDLASCLQLCDDEREKCTGVEYYLGLPHFINQLRRKKTCLLWTEAIATVPDFDAAQLESSQMDTFLFVGTPPLYQCIQKTSMEKILSLGRSTDSSGAEHPSIDPTQTAQAFDDASNAAQCTSPEHSLVAFELGVDVYWQVDLGKSHYVTKIRARGLNDKTQDAYHRLEDARYEVCTGAACGCTPCDGNVSTNGSWVEITCTGNTGRYVRLTQLGTSSFGNASLSDVCNSSNRNATTSNSLANDNYAVQASQYCPDNWVKAHGARMEDVSLQTCKSKCDADPACRAVSFSAIEGDDCVICQTTTVASDRNWVTYTKPGEHLQSKCSDYGEDCCGSETWDEPQTCLDGFIPVPDPECKYTSYALCHSHMGGIGCYGCFSNVSSPDGGVTGRSSVVHESKSGANVLSSSEPSVKLAGSKSSQKNGRPLGPSRNGTLSGTTNVSTAVKSGRKRQRNPRVDVSGGAAAISYNHSQFCRVVVYGHEGPQYVHAISECPVGSKEIGNVFVCQVAAYVLGMTFKSTEKNSTWKHGCKARKGSVYYNLFPTASRKVHINETILCIACEVGKFASTVGQTACQDCDAGKAQGRPGQSECITCPAGTSSGVGQAECNVCEAGKITSIEGEDECHDCIVGSAQDEPGQSECIRCTSGTYASATGMTACITCDGGKSSLALGSSKCDVCPPGYYASKTGSSFCRVCAMGKYAKEEGTKNCTRCETGKSTHKKRASDWCLTCRPGHYAGSRGMVSCETCPPGTYMATSSATSCVECTEGRYQSLRKSTTCELCPLGKYIGENKSTECNSCPPGTYMATSSATSCVECTEGRYQSLRKSTTCELCPLGKYIGENKSTECNSCPDSSGFMTTMRNSRKGSGPPHWIPIPGSLDLRDCRCKRRSRFEKGVCTSCTTEGLDCRGGGGSQTTDYILVEKGYQSDVTLSVYRCFGDLRRCPGGLLGASCAKGRKGNACERCESMMTPGPNGECVNCRAGDAVIFVVDDEVVKRASTSVALNPQRRVVPVVVDEMFRFPTSENVDEWLSLGLVHDTVVHFIVAVFTEIAPTFLASSASDDMLIHIAKKIQKRITQDAAYTETVTGELSMVLNRSHHYSSTFTTASTMVLSRRRTFAL